MEIIMVNVGDLAVYRSGKKHDTDRTVIVDSMTQCRVRVVERIGNSFRRFTVRAEKLTKLSDGLLTGGGCDAAGTH